jgi:DMSO reductase family type II enzyme heme b subunit
VKASGQWSSGKWTVVFIRPLVAAGEEEGIPLAPGGTASVAFALWDGAFRDRDGQKLISIWQDLTLEPVRK